MEMNTRSDIKSDERIDITVGVLEIDEWDHQAVARKVILCDGEGSRIPLTIFNNNDAVTFEWEIGSWYRLDGADGEIYNGEKQLKPSWDFNIVSLDDPPEEASKPAIEKVQQAPDQADTVRVRGPNSDDKPTSVDASVEKTTADGGDAVAQESFQQGNYLLHFALGDLSELDVHTYQLRIPGGIDEQDDLDDGILGFTAHTAARYRYQTGAPVTTNGPLRVYCIEKLHGPIDVDGFTVEPKHAGTETLQSRSYDDQGPLRELVKQDVKSALEGKYDINAINSIVEFNPQIKADSGDFTASWEYKCRIWVDPDGTVICGVNVGFHLQSTFSATEYVRRGYDIAGVSVEHDTDIYDRSGTGTVRALADTGYTEFVDEMGSSTAEYHRDRGYVDERTIESLAAGDPLMAHIDYGKWDGLQALEYCRVVPTLAQLKLVDEEFHSRFQPTSRMRPEERFSIANSFIKSLGTTPALQLEPGFHPSNACYDELSINSSKSNMRFKDGQTASYGAKGLARYGVHQPPSSFDLLTLYPQNYEEESRSYIRELLKKLNDYEANPTKVEQETYPLGSEFGYTQVAKQVDDFDAVLTVVPDQEWIATMSDIDDPYPEFKRQFGQEKIPSQMVQISSLSEEGYLGNIASGLVAKCGGIPWRVHKVPGGADVFIGLDVTYDQSSGQHVGASANMILADGTILASQSVSIQKGETFQVDDIVGIIKNLLNVYLREEGDTPDHVIIHRDGQYYLDLDELVERLEKASELIPKFDLVEIRKSGNPRIASYTGERFEIAQKGTAFESTNADHAYLASTGKPERLPGTPRPIRIVKRRGPTDLETLTTQAYWLSEAHVGSISRSTRLPITTYYADRCAEHARKGYLLSGELIRGVPYL
jgi:hypothetical protein